MIIYNEEKKELIIPTGIGNIDNTIYYDEGFVAGHSSGFTDGFAEGQENIRGKLCDILFTLDGNFTGITKTFPSDGYEGAKKIDVMDNGYGAKNFNDGYLSGYTDGHNSGFTDGWMSAHTYDVVLELDVDCDEQMFPKGNTPILINGKEYQIGSTTGTFIDNIWVLKITTTIVVSDITRCTLQVSFRGDDFDIVGMKIENEPLTVLSVSKEQNSPYYWTISITTEPFSLNPYELSYIKGYTSGYTDGYTSGYTDGRNSGYTDGYSSGWTNGYYSGLTKVIEITLNKATTIYGHVDDEILTINGVESPVLDNTSWYHSSYIKISGQTYFNTLSSIEYAIHANAGADEYPDEWDSVEINGILTTFISQTHEVIDEKWHHYTFTFNNAPIYDRASYEAGLAACQNNENQ